MVTGIDMKSFAHPTLNITTGEADMKDLDEEDLEEEDMKTSVNKNPLS